MDETPSRDSTSSPPTRRRRIEEPQAAQENDLGYENSLDDALRNSYGLTPLGYDCAPRCSKCSVLHHEYAPTNPPATASTNTPTATPERSYILSILANEPPEQSLPSQEYEPENHRYSPTSREYAQTRSTHSLTGWDCAPAASSSSLSSHEYATESPRFSPTSQASFLESPSYSPIIPEFAPTSPTYLLSPEYDPESPENSPITMESAPTSPKYSIASPSYAPRYSSQEPASLEYDIESPQFSPNSSETSPDSPTYSLSPEYAFESSGTSPMTWELAPTSPTYSIASPSYAPRYFSQEPASSGYDTESPQFSPTTSENLSGNSRFSPANLDHSPASPTYSLASPNYDPGYLLENPASPDYGIDNFRFFPSDGETPPESPSFFPANPDYSPRSPTYSVTTWNYANASPTNDEFAPTSPTYSCPEYAPESPRSTPTTQEYVATSPTYSLASPNYAPGNPEQSPTYHDYAAEDVRYSPTSPEYAPTSPSYSITSQDYAPAAPSYFTDRSGYTYNYARGNVDYNMFEVITIEDDSNDEMMEHANRDTEQNHAWRGMSLADRWFAEQPENPTPLKREPELAVSKEIVDSFGPDGLLEGQGGEVTDIKEAIFQEVLREKMVCLVCWTHMKFYKCGTCLYGMCEECTNKIVAEQEGKAVCPHCRREQEQFFVQIELPRRMLPRPPRPPPAMRRQRRRIQHPGGIYYVAVPAEERNTTSSFDQLVNNSQYALSRNTAALPAYTTGEVPQRTPNPHTTNVYGNLMQTHINSTRSNNVNQSPLPPYLEDMQHFANGIRNNRSRRLALLRIQDYATRRPQLATNAASTTLSNTDQQLSLEEAVSKEIVDSFGPNGLIENQDEDITKAEEVSFQKTLRKKMVCDICMTHMKIYKCYKCLYSMCQECTNKITDPLLGYVSCPHCREVQERFVQLQLPRF